MDRTREYRWFYIMVAFSTFEFLMLGFLQGYFGIYFSPLLFFVASMGVSVVALYASANMTEKGKSEQPKQKILFYTLVPLVIMLVWFAFSVFSKHPIDNNKSDVFAQVLSPSQWLLSGEYPYQQVVLPTYTMHNTYLPMQWIPFVLSLVFGFDPRWIPIVFWGAALLLFVWFSSTSTPSRISVHELILSSVTAILAVYSMYGFIVKNSFDFSVTLEMLPTAYYILFVLALLRGSWWGIGLTLGLCLMSRFSIILLIPFLVWYVWKRYGWNTLWKATVTGIAFILVVFVLPFMTKDPDLVSKIFSNYDNGAAGEWSTHSWQESGAEPYQLARGLGAAIFVKRMYEYDIRDGIHHLKQAGFALSFLTGIFLIYLYQRNRIFVNHDWVLLGGIKLYFTFFYTFVLIPYPYLYILPLTITVMIVVKAYNDIFDDNKVKLSR